MESAKKRSDAHYAPGPGNTFLLGLLGQTMKSHELSPAKTLKKLDRLPGFAAGSEGEETDSTDVAADRVQSLLEVKAPEKAAMKELFGLLAF